MGSDKAAQQGPPSPETGWLPTEGPVGHRGVSCPRLMWCGRAQGTGFSGRDPGEIPSPDPTFGLSCFPPSRGGKGGRDFPRRGCGGGKAWGTRGGPGRGSGKLPTPRGAHTHPTGMPQCPQAGEASTSLPNPESPPWPPGLWSGPSPWQSQPCGPGSPWLAGTFAPCPGPGPGPAPQSLGPALPLHPPTRRRGQLTAHVPHQHSQTPPLLP